MRKLLVVPSALALLLAAGVVSISGTGSEVLASPDKPRKVMNFSSRYDRDDSGLEHRSGYRHSRDDDHSGYRDDRDDHDDHDDGVGGRDDGRGDHDDGGYGGSAGDDGPGGDDDHGGGDDHGGSDDSGGHSDDD